MMYIDCSLFSQALQCNTNVKILLPSDEADSAISGVPGTHCENGAKYPVLYLLHGAFDDNTMWPLCTNLRRYAQERRLAVVMPSADNSFYQDLAYGAAYYTYIAEELPRLAENYFCISAKAENRFIGGNSMGGYGALYIALRNPARYAAAFSLSGALDLAQLLQMSAAQGAGRGAVSAARIFGADPAAALDTDANLFRLAERLGAAHTPAPRLRLVCGTEDFLLDANRRAAQVFAQCGLDVSYSEYPGAHGWPFWEKHLEETLAWLPAAGREVDG